MAMYQNRRPQWIHRKNREGDNELTNRNRQASVVFDWFYY